MTTFRFLFFIGLFIAMSAVGLAAPPEKAEGSSKESPAAFSQERLARFEELKTKNPVLLRVLVPPYASALHDRASKLHLEGKNSEALDVQKQALTFCKLLLGNDHPATGDAAHHYAWLLAIAGERDAARPAFEEAVSLRELSLGKIHPRTISTRQFLGDLLSAMGDYPAALACHEEALETVKVFGPKDYSVAAASHAVGQVLQKMGEHAKARPHFETAFTICKDKLGLENFETALMLNSLGEALRDTGQHADAKARFDEALAITKKVAGERHRNTAKILYNLGLLFEATKEFSAAKSSYQEALSIRSEVLEADHPLTIATQEKVSQMEARIRPASDKSAEAPKRKQPKPAAAKPRTKRRATKAAV